MENKEQSQENLNQEPVVGQPTKQLSQEPVQAPQPDSLSQGDQPRSKKLIIIGAIAVVLIIVGGVSAYFFNTNKQSVGNSSNLIVNNYGFNLTVPEGWKICEGCSAFSELSQQEGFWETMEIGLTSTKSQGFQEYMDNWKSETAEMIVFTNSYLENKNRDFEYVGKIISTAVDSSEMLKLGTTEMFVSNAEVDFNKDVVSNNNFETKYIDIDNRKAFLQVGKKLNLVDLVIVKVQINTDKFINGEEVKSLTFVKYVKKGDATAVDRLISFIAELNLTEQ